MRQCREIILRTGGDFVTGLHRGFLAGLSTCLTAALMTAGLTAVSGPGTAALAAAPPMVNLRVLLIGEGSGDPTTAAWQAALTSEGVPYTLVTAAGSAPSETLNLPALSSGGTGDFNGVVIADSPADYASGQLTAWTPTSPRSACARWTATCSRPRRWA
jgi:hypothetical protein